MAKGAAVEQPMTKAQLLSGIAQDTGLTKKQVSEVFDSLSGYIEQHIRKRGPGTFAFPGMFKIKTVHKPATSPRKGINPFTGEEAMFAAKAARTIVKIQPLKALKDMAN